jgi:hypothetical protein
MQSHEACCGTMFWVYLMSCVGLVMFAGLMSGLTLGLMSLSLVDLEVLAKAGTPKDKLNAGGYFDPLLLQSAPDFLPPAPSLVRSLLLYVAVLARSQDPAGRQEPAPPALHAPHRQLARHGGAADIPRHARAVRRRHTHLRHAHPRVRGGTSDLIDAIVSVLQFNSSSFCASPFLLLHRLCVENPARLIASLLFSSRRSYRKPSARDTGSAWEPWRRPSSGYCSSSSSPSPTRSVRY